MHNWILPELRTRDIISPSLDGTRVDVAIKSKQEKHTEIHSTNEKYAKKWDIFTEMRESGMELEKLDFSPESGNVDSYGSFLPLTEKHNAYLQNFE